MTRKTSRTGLTYSKHSLEALLALSLYLLYPGRPYGHPILHLSVQLQELVAEIQNMPAEHREP